MGLISLGIANPDFFNGKSVVGDILDAQRMRADYESNAPTGLPSMDDVAGWEQILIGLKTETGQIVTPERAKRCATVLAIIRGLSEDTSALRRPVYKRFPTGDEEYPDHEVYALLNSAPNDIMTPMEMGEHIMLDLLLWGNFFVLKNPRPDGTIDSLWPLQAQYVARRWRELVWAYSDPTTGVSGEFIPDFVWRGTTMSLNGVDGYAITLLCKEAIGLLLAAEEQAARLFSHGVQTDFVLESPDEVGPEEKKDIRSALMQRHAGSSRAWIPLILSGGLKASKLGLTAQESQYIEARKFQVSSIAQAFRYPEVLLGGSASGKSSTYASAEQFFMSYTKHTLGPWTTRIDQTANRDLFMQNERKRLYAKTDFSSLLKADEAARVDIWNKKIAGGWARPSEARRAEGMTYAEGLDFFVRAKNMDSLGGANDDPAPTDQSGRQDLPRRVARMIFRKEHKALIYRQASADMFYTTLGAFVEDLTGAPSAKVHKYLEMRRTAADRFSSAAQEAAMSALISLCKGE